MSSFTQFRDALLQDPEFREGFEDAQALARLRDGLVRLREAQKIPQTEVAKRMGVGQPTVSEFENSANDPRVSTLQRYARAVSARLDLRVDLPADTAWGAPATRRWVQQRAESTRLRVQMSASHMVTDSQVQVAAWSRDASSRRDDFALGA